MLTIVPSVLSIVRDNTGFQFKDITGDYDNPDNLTGYGSPNEDYTDLDYGSIQTQKYGTSTVLTAATYDTHAEVAVLLTPTNITHTLTDGVHTVRFWMGRKVVSTADISTSLIVAVAAGPKALSTGYTYISAIEDPFTKVKVNSIEGNNIILDEALSTDLAGSQSAIIYWWMAETKIVTVNDAAIKLAKRLAYKHCDCASELEFHCMLLRAQALFTLEDYAGANQLITYVKQRLC